MLTFNLKLVDRVSTRTGNNPPVHGWNKLAVPSFIGDTAINAALGAGWTIAGHWVGSSIFTSASRSGYSVRGSQYINPALIGCAVGPVYKWCKEAVWAIAPGLKEQKSWCASVLRIAASTVLSSGTAALVGVVVSITAHHRGEPTYPDIARGAVLAVTGDVIIGTALLIIFTAATSFVACCFGTREPGTYNWRYRV